MSLSAAKTILWTSSQCFAQASPPRYLKWSLSYNTFTCNLSISSCFKSVLQNFWSVLSEAFCTVTSVSSWKSTEYLVSLLFRPDGVGCLFSRTFSPLSLLALGTGCWERSCKNCPYTDWMFWPRASLSENTWGNAGLSFKCYNETQMPRIFPITT